MKNQSAQTVLVTGATSGIGRELARLFAQDGCHLVMVARNEEGLQQVAREFEQEFGIRTTVICKDLTDPKAPEEIYQETARQGLTVDVLVNNAGVGEYGLFATESDLQKELSIIQLNIGSLVSLTKLYLKDMVQRNEGRILMLGSIASVMPNPLMAVYGATKAFVYSFSEALRNELKDTDVTVTVLMPPATDTDFFNKAGATHTVAQQQAHSMSPAEVAKAGYDALMSGKDKVAAGMKTKVMAAAAHLFPDPMVTQSARNLMKTPEEAEQERRSQARTNALTFGLAAVAFAGLWLVSRSGNGRRNGNGAFSDFNGRRYRSKAKAAGRSARNVVNSAADSVKSTYHDAKAAVEQALA
ncbi:SDR family NAD(P)-dependent oxidoreductase [Larkinella soli]|uniref:SDR family NAD(P)-dependent oxidoreductase n=1 Tax=Larkinella soli TaxID=1770527 RepID=UPI000FFBEEC5|nr:SDR family oxidoreductase [Larkinella soli]